MIWMILLWFLFLTVFLFTIWSLYRLSKSQTGRQFEIVFFLAILFLLVVGRGPSTLIPRPLNPDEAQTLAQAITFASKPIPWVDVDSTTSGPINSWVLMWPYLFGFDPGYASSRALMLLFLWSTLFFVYWGFKSFIDRGWAGVSVLGACVFWATNIDGELIHFSSEIVPVFLLSIGFSMILKSFQNSSNYLHGGVLVLSLVPFTKLQAIAIALPLVGIGILHLAWFRGWRFFLQSLPMLVVAGTVLPACILIPVIHSGGWSDFWHSYLEFPLSYGNIHGKGPLNTIFHTYQGIGEARVLFLLSAIAWLFSLFALWNRSQETSCNSVFKTLGTNALWVGLLIVVFYCSSLIAIIKPGTGFSHYWQFIVIPSVAIIGYLFLCLKQLTLINKWGPIVVGSFLVSIFVYKSGDLVPKSINHFHQLQLPSYFPEIVEYINRNKQRGDELTVWGWEANLHVVTKLPAATRDTITPLAMPNPERAITFLNLPANLKQYYQDRFMSDITENPPAFVVDACSPGSFGFASIDFGVECFKPLSEFLNKNYTLRIDTSSEQIHGQRLWVRNDRI